MLTADFGDAVNGADHRSGFNLRFADFVDSINLRDPCLTEVIFCSCSFKIGFLCFGTEEVTEGFVNPKEVVLLFSKRLLSGSWGQVSVVAVVQQVCSEDAPYVSGAFCKAGDERLGPRFLSVGKMMRSGRFWSSRIMVCCDGDKLWQQIFGSAFHKLLSFLSKEARANLQSHF